MHATRRWCVFDFKCADRFGQVQNCYSLVCFLHTGMGCDTTSPEVNMSPLEHTCDASTDLSLLSTTAQYSRGEQSSTQDTSMWPTPVLWQTKLALKALPSSALDPYNNSLTCFSRKTRFIAGPDGTRITSKSRQVEDAESHGNVRTGFDDA